MSGTMVRLPSWMVAGHKVRFPGDHGLLVRNKVYTIEKIEVELNENPRVCLVEVPNAWWWIGSFEPVYNGIERAIERLDK